MLGRAGRGSAACGTHGYAPRTEDVGIESLHRDGVVLHGEVPPPRWRNFVMQLQAELPVLHPKCLGLGGIPPDERRSRREDASRLRSRSKVIVACAIGQRLRSRVSPRGSRVPGFARHLRLHVTGLCSSQWMRRVAVIHRPSTGRKVGESCKCSPITSFSRSA